MADSWPCLFAIGVLLAGVGWMLLAGVTLGGAFTYPLDDPYIHLSVARHVLEYGVWGVTATVSTSASSSPLWTCLLVLLGAAGVPLEYAPLVLNLAAAMALLLAADRLFADAGLPDWPRALALVLLLAVGYVPTQTLLGMEHSLHAGLCLWLLLALRRVEQPPWRSAALMLSAVMPLVRLESMVVIGAAAVMLLPRWWRSALALITAAVLPVAGFVLLSVAMDWLWLPNPVLLKLASAWSSNEPLLERFSGVSAIAGLAAPLLLLQCSGVVPVRLRREAVVVTATLIAQAAVIVEPRYVGYLAAMIIVTLLSTLWVVVRAVWQASGWRVDIVAAIALVLLASWRAPAQTMARVLFGDVPISMRNIADQQRQSARFVRDFLTARGAVVITDLGFVSFAGGREVIDLMGLGHTAIARSALGGSGTWPALQAAAQSSGARTALVYTSWIAELTPNGALPADWVRIGSWTIADNVICGDATVTVFATAAEAAPQLRRDFAAFAGTLPARTVVEVD